MSCIWLYSNKVHVPFLEAIYIECEITCRLKISQGKPTYLRYVVAGLFSTANENVFTVRIQHSAPVLSPCLSDVEPYLVTYEAPCINVQWHQCTLSHDKYLRQETTLLRGHTFFHFFFNIYHTGKQLLWCNDAIWYRRHCFTCWPATWWHQAIESFTRQLALWWNER